MRTPRLARRGENRVPLPGWRGFFKQGQSEKGRTMNKSDKGPSQISKAPPPITPLRGGGSPARLGGHSVATPDWKFWLQMPDVRLWQACALSLDIDPDSMKRDSASWMAGGSGGPFLESESFRQAAEETEFYKRLRLLKANLHDRRHFSPQALNMRDSNQHAVSLSEVAAWGEFVGWREIPSALVQIARPPKGKKRKAVETPAQRAKRILHRVAQEKTKGTRDFLKVVAKEEDISVSRLKQIRSKGIQSKAKS